MFEHAFEEPDELASPESASLSSHCLTAISKDPKPLDDPGSVASHCSSRAFGVPEMREFAKDHPDERVRLMMKRLDETRSRSARWCEAMQRMEQLRKEVMKLRRVCEFAREACRENLAYATVKNEQVLLEAFSKCDAALKP